MWVLWRKYAKEYGFVYRALNKILKSTVYFIFKSFLFLLFFSGGCSFDEPFTSCGYSQSDNDDFNWDQVNTFTKPTTDPWMPTGSFYWK